MNRGLTEFGRRAYEYESHALVQNDLIDWLKRLIPKQDFSGECCLEYGAGTGLLTRELVHRFSSVTATDIEHKMLSEGSLHVPQATWQLRDAWNPQASHITNPYDAVASASLLQWAPNRTQAIQAQISSLKTGGLFMAGFFVAPSLPELGACLGADNAFVWWTPEEWTESIEHAGIHILRTESVTRTYFYPDVISLLRQIHGVGGVMKDRVGVVGLKQLLINYEHRFREANGIPSTWTFFGILGTKMNKKKKEAQS